MSTQLNGNLQIKVSPEVHQKLWERVKRERKRRDGQTSVSDVIEYYLWRGMEAER